MQKNKAKKVRYDDELRLEAYHFTGVSQTFPNHFHDYYVIGYIEAGTRLLSCKGAQYRLGDGDVILFNPGDNHGCIQGDDNTFNYRAVNISKETMRSLVKEMTGSENRLEFTENVIHNCGLGDCVCQLHKMIMENAERMCKEEAVFMLLSLLMQDYAGDMSGCGKGNYEKSEGVYDSEIDRMCLFIEEHYEEHITLEQLCELGCMSKSTLLRTFTRQKGVTPYRYLLSVRVGKAKELIEQGTAIADAAAYTGFLDQSHFTRVFGMFIGLSPAVYQRIFKTIL